MIIGPLDLLNRKVPITSPIGDRSRGFHRGLDLGYEIGDQIYPLIDPKIAPLEKWVGTSAITHIKMVWAQKQSFPFDESTLSFTYMHVNASLAIVKDVYSKESNRWEAKHLHLEITMGSDLIDPLPIFLSLKLIPGASIFLPNPVKTFKVLLDHTKLVLKMKNQGNRVKQAFYLTRKLFEAKHVIPLSSGYGPSTGQLRWIKTIYTALPKSSKITVGYGLKKEPPYKLSTNFVLERISGGWKWLQKIILK